MNRQLLFEPASWVRGQDATGVVGIQPLSRPVTRKLDIQPGTKPNVSTSSSDSPKTPKTLKLWGSIAAKAKAEKNPWEKHELHKLPLRQIVHHFYHCATGTWEQHDGFAKISSEAFDAGAMRECYRALLTEPSNPDHKLHAFNWKRAANCKARPESHLVLTLTAYRN